MSLKIGPKSARKTKTKLPTIKRDNHQTKLKAKNPELKA